MKLTNQVVVKFVEQKVIQAIRNREHGFITITVAMVTGGGARRTFDLVFDPPGAPQDVATPEGGTKKEIKPVHSQRVVLNAKPEKPEDAFQVETFLSATTYDRIDQVMKKKDGDEELAGIEAVGKTDGWLDNF